MFLVKWFSGLLLAVVFSFTTACGCSPDTCGAPDTEGGYSTDRGESGKIPDTGAYIKKLKVDGTTCIIFKDGDGSAITCNWETKPTVEPTDDPFSLDD